ncbi:UNVERIFIED_CONTAM: hypothetical protein C3P01_09245 [Clostridioides difficile]|uniref:hypothetical protein n=1 Tax=Clostridioides difficile TaxID=1496 RepID=UPI0005157ED2|nr:hypothetical protein [Clostridioides difficile]MDC2930857.1 hypothetical protein [Clostridioides difficile]MDE3610600.1 hypothetical protein [Clostridioides difficile]MDM9791575.1 hypothetical protein [Clostridioides difficile]HBF7936945.1 hypothetical protein [Clostridioides difficile]HBG6490251.1 hypothetical protein [Clostridioides difficile]
MGISNIITIIISVLSSSIFTLLLSTIILEPMKEKKKYIFDEKKRVYESLVIFAQIVLYPSEAKYSLGVERYNIQELSNEENVSNALNDLKMAIPKLKLITKNPKIINRVEMFIQHKNESTFNDLVDILQKDLYK